jgi:DNA-binding NarL/FixJ family response regulator
MSLMSAVRSTHASAPAQSPVHAQPRIGIVGAAPWLARGLVDALADAARWQLVPMPGFEAAAAYVVHAQDADEAAAWHAALPPQAPVVWIGAPPQESDGDAVRPPAQALLPADASAEQLRAALAAVLVGLNVRDPARPWPQARPGSLSASAAAQTEPLTSRELEVFELLAKGLSNRDVAGVLGISVHTAKFHVAQILAKVGAATRAEAVALGLRLGLIGL